MKAVTTILLLANVAVLYWQYGEHVDRVTTRAKVAPASQFEGPRISLLKELAELPPVKSAPNAEPARPKTDFAERYEHVEAADRCIDIGPFDDSNARDLLRDWLRDYVALLDSRVEPVRGRQLFWVYLEPTSEELAAENLGRLASSGVTDYMLIRRGDLKNAISLGLFSSQDSVNRRLSELSQKGYQPVVVPHFETKDTYWLYARLAANVGADFELPQGLLAQANSSAVTCVEADSE